MHFLHAVTSVTALTILLPAQVPPVPPLLGDHVERTSALAREHQFHASIAGRVLLHDGAPAVGATVLAFAYRPFYWALPLATARTDERGAFRCDDVSGCGRTLLWAVAPMDSPFRAANASLTLVSGRHTELRPITLPAPTGAPEPATMFRGKLLAGNGAPIAGALLRLTGADSRFDPSCFGVTDAVGAFAIPVRSGAPERAQLFFGSSRWEIEHQAGAATLAGDPPKLQLDLTGERTLQRDEITWVDVSARGAEGITLAWRLGDRFQPCTGNRAPASSSRFGAASPLVRAAAPGHLPRLGHAPETKFDFADDAPMQLQVVDDAGKPVANAVVDLCSSAFGARFQEALLETMSTGDDGALRLRGPKDAATVVYVYAPGCDPARASWNCSAPLRVVLARRTARLHLDLDDDVSTIYVRRAGTFDMAAMVYPDRGGLDLDLAPGAYEVTRYRQGPVAAAAPVMLAAGATTALPLDGDLRPTIVVTVPAFEQDDGWWVHASRSAVGGMVANRAIWTTRGGPMPTRELVAVVEPQGPRKFLLRLPTSGRYTLCIGHEKMAQRAIREVEVAFGSNYAIELPALDGVLRGTIAAAPEMWNAEFGMDGVAGPRLWLEPEGDTAFGMLVTLPAPKEFQISQLPRGSFTLHHHLYETERFRSADGTWGGSPITVAGTPAAAGTLQRGPDAELQVSVLAADGKPAVGLLAIRDRMHESWQQVVAENSTLVYASDPIPTPPSARLVDGKATLGKVRKGRLHFELQGDDGSTVFFARDVAPGTRLEVRLGSAK